MYKSPGAETYVIFGEAKIEDMNAQAAAAAAEQFKTTEEDGGDDDDDVPELADATETEAASEAAADKTEAAGEEEDDLDHDELHTIMTQANCTKAEAAVALRKHKNIVDAILVRNISLYRVMFCGLTQHFCRN